VEELAAEVEAAQRGDAAAFTRLVARFQDRIFALTFAKLGDYHTAQDATQEAFLEAYLNLHRLAAPEAFPVWLRRIALGKCIRQIRSTKSVRAVAPLYNAAGILAPEPGPQQRLESREERERLRGALAALPQQERAVLVLYGIGGYAYAEIADLTQAPLGTVKKRLHTARQRLKALLPEYAAEAALRSTRPAPADALAERLRARRTVTSLSEEEKSMEIEILGPSEEYKPIVKNLYTFYRYDLMPFLHEGARSFVNAFGVLNGETSQTHEEGVQGEEVWWQHPGKLAAYLIHADSRPAGFVLVASQPFATRGVDYRLNELFVLNKVRQKGVATAAVRRVFDLLPGKWEVAYMPENVAAASFWRKFVPAYAPGRFEEAMVGMGVDVPSLPGYVFDNAKA